MSKTEAETYLQSLLCKTLRITTTDSRMFLGQFKCTDSDRNIILSHTYEYRPPSQSPPTAAELQEGKVVRDMTSRYLGLVVVPGEHIVGIMVEEFASQLKGKGKEGQVVGSGA